METVATVDEFTGQIDAIAFHSEENGFSVLRVKQKGQRDVVNAVGSMVSPVVGEMLALKGEWFHHQKFGRQFKFESYQTMRPATVDGIEKYLGSGIIKGIGPLMAKRLVEAFGKDTFDIIDNAPDRLIEIDGIGQVRQAKIREAWEEQREVRQIMIFLQQFGVGPSYAVKIFKKYGGGAIPAIEENPYRLATDINGIGFKKADQIAIKLGFELESDFRVEAGIVFTLQELSMQGHVCYPQLNLIEKAREVLQVDSRFIIDGISRAAEKNTVVVDKSMGRDLPVYLKRLYSQETALGLKIGLLRELPSSIRVGPNVVSLVETSQKNLRISLAPKQQKAAEMALTEKISIISGGPGTGKTTLIRTILKALEKSNAKVLLAAPTGRAAKRMSETTGHEAQTIHRLLSFQNGSFLYDEDQPLECDMLIVDEASMIDLSLMYHLVSAIPGGAILVLVGDIHQLPSVGAGNILCDLIASETIPVTILTEIFRQARESRIVTNAHRINEGFLPEMKNSSSDDFFFIPKEDPEDILQTIVELVQDRVPRSLGYDPVNDIQVLSPMHKGLIGAENINRQLQDVLNPCRDQGHQISRAGRIFRVGDKVLHTRNNYDLDVFNGDIGTIESIDNEEGQVRINYDGRSVLYEMQNMDEVTLAYCITIHKSQGSEYPVVIMPVSNSHYIMLQRNLMYTGVTRGKKLVILVGTPKAMAMAVKNNQTKKRHSLLKKRLECAQSNGVFTQAGFF